MAPQADPASLRAALSQRANLLTPHSPSAEWEKALHRWSAVAEAAPLAVAQVATVRDVQACLEWVRREGVPLALRGGGHGTAPGVSAVDDGLVIDLRGLNSVEVAEDRESVKVGGGAIWGEVFEVVDAAKLAVVGGGYWEVGVGGFLTGAGYSWLTGLYGLGVDNVLAAEVVLANGTLVRCSEQEEKDLFWSIRGGSSNFGVVTSFTLKAYPSFGGCLAGAMFFAPEQLLDVYECVREFLTVRKPTESFVFQFGCDPDEGKPLIGIFPWIVADSKEDAVQNSSLAPFFSKIKPVRDFTYYASSLTELGHAADAVLSGGPRRKMNTITLFSETAFREKDFVQGAWDRFIAFSERQKGCQVHFEMHDPQKTASFPADATGFHAGGRNPHFYALAVAMFDDAKDDDECEKWATDLTRFLREQQIKHGGVDLHGSGNSSQGKEPVEDVYAGHLERMRRNKRKYDPDNLFCRWYPLGDKQAKAAVLNGIPNGTARKAAARDASGKKGGKREASGDDGSATKSGFRSTVKRFLSISKRKRSSSAVDTPEKQ